jgi:hypothetical protein
VTDGPLLSRIIKPGHGSVIASRGTLQIVIYLVGGGIGALFSSSIVSFALCTVALVALEIRLARKYDFLPRQGSINLNLSRFLWFRLLTAVIGIGVALLLLAVSFEVTGPVSALPGVFASILAYAAIGVNLPDSLVSKAREQ